MWRAERSQQRFTHIAVRIPRQHFRWIGKHAETRVIVAAVVIHTPEIVDCMDGVGGNKCITDGIFGTGACHKLEHAALNSDYLGANRLQVFGDYRTTPTRDPMLKVMSVSFLAREFGRRCQHLGL